MKGNVVPFWLGRRKEDVMRDLRDRLYRGELTTEQYLDQLHNFPRFGRPLDDPSP